MLASRYLIQYEVGIGYTVFKISPVEKGKLTEPGPFDPLQKLLGNDLVGIHVRPVERRNDAL